MMKNVRSNVIVVALFGGLLLGVNFSIANAQTQQWTFNWDLTGNDGLRVYNAKHNAVEVIEDARLPFIWVWYPDNGNIIWDGIGSGTNNRIDHGPHLHTGTGYSARHFTVYFGPCPIGAFPSEGCYKYEQYYYFYDSATLPRFVHTIKIHGEGYEPSWGWPVYKSFWRVDTDVPTSTPGNDVYQAKISGTWTLQSTEIKRYAGGTGDTIRTYDNGATSKYINLDPDDSGPYAWLLRAKTNEMDPSSSAEFPDKYMTSPESINIQDDLYWIYSYALSSDTTCNHLYPCTLGPTLRLSGGL